VLFVLEAKFVSHGVLAVGGVLAMVFGAVMLFESPVPEMGVRWGTAISVAIPFAAITVFLLRLVLKSRAWKMAAGAEEMVGEIGEVRQAIEGEGLVFIHGENWRAISEQKIPAGMKVRVVSVEGLKVRVEAVSTQASTSSQRSS
ncbi:MAG TPA: NfeD family protein, partial [Candidatus Acidoferrales bacterium]